MTEIPKPRQAREEDREWLEPFIKEYQKRACKFITGFENWWEEDQYVLYVIPEICVAVWNTDDNGMWEGEDFYTLVVSFTKDEFSGRGYQHLLETAVDSRKRCRVNKFKMKDDDMVQSLEDRGYELNHTREGAGRDGGDIMVFEADHSNGYEYDEERLDI